MNSERLNKSTGEIVRHRERERIEAEAEDFAPAAVRCALDIADVLQVHDWDPMGTKTGIVSEKLHRPKPRVHCSEKSAPRCHRRSYLSARPRARSTG